jgi:hypothetical protein
MKKVQEIGSWIKFILLIAPITLILILFVSKLPKKQDYESIKNDASIFKNGSPLLPTLRSINNTCFVYKKLSRYYYNLTGDCFIPNTDSDIYINVIYDKMETIGGYWYGEDCFLKFTNSNKVILGNPEKSSNNWGESILHGGGVTKIKPTFRCSFSPHSIAEKNKVIAEMTITYPIGSGTFSNKVQQLKKEFNLVLIPKEKYIALTNYERRQHNPEIIGLAFVIYVLTIVIIIYKSFF